MQCPECKGKSKVYGTVSYGTAIERYRVCQRCHYRWRTYEELDNRPIRQHQEDYEQNDDINVASN